MIALAIVALGVALASMATLAALESVREGRGFDFLTPLVDIVQPAGASAALQLAGSIVFGAIGGLFTAAVLAARHRQTEETPVG